ncbi:hypothetical protein IV203_034536 [Nitzschia inconspicua]|uniref:Uncharacterized protein n=1 Tax=Nitzschia inconspicua TaxID=303405 RepID=A0A9K3LCB7_9STRA|nr:hypothetical protein IV203_002591 [Nitzschia inconspicua]KAG7359438.1 hypothetical protein IV203_034536 [Nitzschia inconspicua]
MAPSGQKYTGKGGSSSNGHENDFGSRQHLHLFLNSVIVCMTRVVMLTVFDSNRGYIFAINESNGKLALGSLVEEFMANSIWAGCDSNTAVSKS